MLRRTNRLKLDIVTILFVIATVAGAIFLINCASRARGITAELEKTEVDIRSLTQAQLALERSYTSSSQLPTLVGPFWEKDVISGFEKALNETDVTTYRLQYTKNSSRSAKNVGTVNFELELTGNKEALLRSISLLRSYVQAAKIDTIDVLPGKGKFQGLYTMKLTGVIYYLVETKPDVDAK